MHRRLFVLLISISLFHTAVGQNKPDTAFVLNAVNSAKKAYIQELGTHTILHNGVEHKHYKDDVEQEAYLEPDWQNGSIFYDKELFENVPLMYDMIAQQVVTYFFGQADIDLITDKVDWFIINGRKFVYLGRSAKDSGIDPAFYELLDNGNVKLYVQRRKKMHQKIGEKNITYSVSGVNHYFLYKDGKYFPVNGKRALVAALKDKKKELKQFKRENKIHFDKESRETAIKQYVARYNELQ